MSASHSKVVTWLAGKETDYGTGVGADKDFGLIQSFSPTDKRVHTKIQTAGSREIQEIVAGLVDFDWELNLFYQHARPLQMLLGTLSHAETTGDWKHSITSVASSVPSYTIEYSFNKATDLVFDYFGSKANQETITLEKDGVLSCNISGKSQNADTSEASAGSAVIDDLNVLHYKHADVLVGVAGSESSIGKVQSFNLSFNNTPKMVDSTGTILHQEHVEGLFEPTADFTIVFENLTEYQRFLGTTSSTVPQISPTPFSTIFNLHNGVTLGSGRQEFYAQLDDCQYEEVGNPLNVGEIVISSFRMNAVTLGSNGVFGVDDVSSTNFD